MTPKVRNKKLGRQKLDGICYTGINVIHIDERLRGKDYLETALHEFHHLKRPQETEEEVLDYSKDLMRFLWKLHYRKVDNGKK